MADGLDNVAIDIGDLTPRKRTFRHPVSREPFADGEALVYDEDTGRLRPGAVSGGGGAPHAILDGGTAHTDSATDSVSRGSLIVGNSTPAWDELVIGASGRYLRSDGSDPSWTAIVSGDLPSTVVETTDADWIDLTDGGATTLHSHAGGSGHAIQDEGTAIASRASLDFRGAYVQAYDEASATASRVSTGYSHYDAIVDSDQQETKESNTATSVTTTTLTRTGAGWTTDQWAGFRVVITSGGAINKSALITANTSDTLTFGTITGLSGTPTYIIQLGPPVYRRLAEAIGSGARSILLRKTSGEVDFTIASTDSVTYIVGDDVGDATIDVAIDCQKASLVFQNLLFSGNKALQLNATGATCVGCRFTSSAYVRLIGAGASLVACYFSGAGGAAQAPVSVEGSDNRIQACSFILQASAGLVVATSAARRTAVTGCLNVSNAETGYLYDFNDANNDATINGCLVNVPTTGTGGIRVNVLCNVSGNYVQVNPTGSGTYIGISFLARCLLTGNTVRSGSQTGASTVKAFVGVGGDGNVISGNVILSASVSNASAVFRCIELQAGAEGTAIVGNLAFSVVYISGTLVFVYAADTAASRFAATGNILSGSTYSPVNPWLVSSQIGVETEILGTAGIPPITAYRLFEKEDFRLGVAPAGWTEFGTGGAGSYATAVQGGIVRLTTGGANNEKGIKVDYDHVSFDNGHHAYFGCHFDISVVTNAQVWIGLAPTASWAAAMARPTNGLFLELDTTVDANWHLLVMDGGVIRLNLSLGGAAAGVNTVEAVIDRSNRAYVWLNGVATRSTTTLTLPATLVTPGAYYQYNSAGAQTLDISQMKWGCDQR